MLTELEALRARCIAAFQFGALIGAKEPAELGWTAESHERALRTQAERCLSLLAEIRAIDADEAERLLSELLVHREPEFAPPRLH